MHVVDSDIATVEALHDLLLIEGKYPLSSWVLKRSRKLTAKMYKALYG